MTEFESFDRCGHTDTIEFLLLRTISLLELPSTSRQCGSCWTWQENRLDTPLWDRLPALQCSVKDHRGLLPEKNCLTD